MSSFLATLPPDAAILLCTLGLALLAIELNRPGAILPGAVGLLLTLLAAAALLHRRPHPAAIALVAAAAAILLAQLRLHLPVALSVLATLALVAGLLWLFPSTGHPHIHPATAVVCGLVLGAGTTVLTRLAYRARRNKGLD